MGISGNGYQFSEANTLINSTLIVLYMFQQYLNGSYRHPGN